MDKLLSEQDSLSHCLSSDPDYILDACGDILSFNEHQCVLKKTSASEKARELVRIIVEKGDKSCQTFLDILKQNRERFPQLQQLFQGSPSPTVAAVNNSVVTAREIKNITAGSLSMKVEVERGPGTTQSDSRGVVPQADLVAQDCSVVCADKITGADISGDMDFSVSITQAHVHQGGADEPEYFLQGPAVDMIRDLKAKLINCLMSDLFILQHAHSRRFVDDRQYQNLKNLPEPEQSVTNLIDHVITKGQDVCAEFLQVLEEDELLQTYPTLKAILNIGT